MAPEDHASHERPGEAPGAGGVDLEDPVEGLGAQLGEGLEGGGAEGAGVVDEQVDAAHEGLGPTGEGRRSVGLAHVGHHAVGPAALGADGVDGLAQGGGPAGHHHHLDALPGEGQGEGATEALAGAGDEGGAEGLAEDGGAAAGHGLPPV